MAEILQIRLTENLMSSSHPHGFLVSNFNRFKIKIFILHTCKTKNDLFTSIIYLNCLTGQL